MTIVCLGEAIVDLVCEREVAAPVDADRFVPHPGGALANVAVAAARAGADVAILGGVGADDWGQWLRRGLLAEKVGVGWLASVAAIPTPLALVTFGPAREPSFQVYGEGIGATMRAADRFLEEAMSEASALVLGSNTLASEPERQITLRARRAALDRGIPILFDPNLRPNRWEDVATAVDVCREFCEGAFLVRANLAEAELLTGIGDPAEAADALCRLGAGIGVVTTGPGGAVMRGGASGEAAAPRVEVVAPLGAGDAMMGTMVAGLARAGWDAAGACAALRAATAAGAAACERWGSQ